MPTASATTHETPAFNAAANRERSRGVRSALLVIVVISGIVRGMFLIPVLQTGKLDDPDNYLPLARSLAEGQGFALGGHPTAYRPPLYPMILAPFSAMLGERVLWGVAALHLVLGGMTVLLTALTARRWGISTGRMLVAATIVALDPVLVAQSKSVMTETLAAVLSAASLAAVTAPRAWSVVLGGGMFGLAALCRPSTLPIAFVASAFAISDRSSSFRQGVVRGAGLLLVTCLILTPWAIRNIRAVGAPIFTTTHGGYTLALANNPVYYDEVVNGPPGSIWTGHNQWVWWDSVNRETRGMSEPAADRFLRDGALRVVRDRPKDFMRASMARLGRFWGISPSGAVYPVWLRIATACWTLPLWLALIRGLCRREIWNWPLAAAPSTLIALSLVHSVYWTDMRMRAAAVPAIALISACAGSATIRQKVSGIETNTVVKTLPGDV